MYIPKAFREDDLETLHAFIREHNFGTVITLQNGLPVANHFPFILNTSHGSQGMLLAHMARANAQWQAFNEAQEVLVIFQGPHTYVTPSWYIHDPALSVPTWNYAVVHAYGLPRLIEDPQELYSILRESVETFEAHFEHSWIVQPLDEFTRYKMKGIVGFAVEITRLEGKFKLSQNRPAVDRERVIDALKKQGSEVAELMDKYRTTS